jgi:hypothetical protein
MALACEIVGEDDITRSEPARGAVADRDFHLPHENKNVLPPGRGVPIARMVRRETAEHEVGALNRNVVALLSRQREILKWVWPSWPVYIRTIMRVSSHRGIIMHAKADSALSPRIKPLASRLHTLPPECGQKHQAHVVFPLLT